MFHFHSIFSALDLPCPICDWWVWVSCSVWSLSGACLSALCSTALYIYVRLLVMHWWWWGVCSAVAFGYQFLPGLLQKCLPYWSVSVFTLWQALYSFKACLWLCSKASIELWIGFEVVMTYSTSQCQYNCSYTFWWWHYKVRPGIHFSPLWNPITSLLTKDEWIISKSNYYVFPPILLFSILLSL